MISDTHTTPAALGTLREPDPAPTGSAGDDGATDPPSEKRTAAGRLLALIGAFARGGGALTLSELSRYADLPLTTTHRLVRELLAWGGVEQDASGRYRLSNKILELASRSTRAFQLRERALPALIDLQRHTGLGVQLAAREDDHVVFLEALRTMPNFSGENRIGGQLPLHATGTGLVLLAHSEPEFLDRYLSRPLHAYTAHTPTDPDEIRRQLALIRERRYAVTARTISLEAGTVAAPIHGPEGDVVAAVNVIYYMQRHDTQPLIPQVLETACRITAALQEQRTHPDPRTVDFNRRQASLG